MPFTRHLPLVGALSLLATTSFAADGANWTGFTLGFDAGTATHESTVSDLDYDWIGGSQVQHSKSRVVGLHVGYDHQIRNLVLGAELNWSKTDFDNGQQFYNDQTRVTSEVGWLGSLRVRGGVAIDNALLYVTGGLAKGDITHALESSDYPTYEFSKDVNRWGSVMGIGIEGQVLPKVSIRFEYDMYDFGETKAKDGQGNEFSFADAFTTLTVGATYRL